MLTLWRPERHLPSLFGEFDALFDRLARFDDVAPASSWATLPLFRVEEQKDALLITAELPGLGPEDVQIEVEGDVLHVRHEHGEEKKDDGGSYGHALRFSRSFRIPNGVEAERIEASMKNGVLAVRLPKREPQRVSVKVS